MKGFGEAVAEEIERQGAHLMTGAAADYANYRERVGRLTGLKDALEIYKDLQRKQNA